jgi:hypothetical protein
MFKKHNFIAYGNSADIVKIEILTCNNNSIDHFKCNSNKELGKVMRILKEKYGMQPEYNDLEKETQEEKKKDVDWLSMDF